MALIVVIFSIVSCYYFYQLARRIIVNTQTLNVMFWIGIIVIIIAIILFIVALWQLFRSETKTTETVVIRQQPIPSKTPVKSVRSPSIIKSPIRSPKPVVNITQEDIPETYSTEEEPMSEDESGIFSDVDEEESNGSEGEEELPSLSSSRYRRSTQKSG